MCSCLFTDQLIECLDFHVGLNYEMHLQNFDFILFDHNYSAAKFCFNKGLCMIQIWYDMK